MSNVQSTPPAATKAPPIPSMDLNPAPPATTAKEISQEVRDIAKQAKIAARDAKQAAQDAANPQAAPHIATTTTAPPAPFDASNVIPPQAVDISLGFFLTVAVCVVGFPIARALGRRIDRKTDFKAVAAPDLTPHIRQLQDSVDAMAIELERISEGQRFTAKLLAERSGGSGQQ
jgi:hypothetical protein